MKLSYKGPMVAIAGISLIASMPKLIDNIPDTTRARIRNFLLSRENKSAEQLMNEIKMLMVVAPRPNSDISLMVYSTRGEKECMAILTLSKDSAEFVIHEKFKSHISALEEILEQLKKSIKNLPIEKKVTKNHIKSR